MWCIDAHQVFEYNCGEVAVTIEVLRKCVCVALDGGQVWRVNEHTPAGKQISGPPIIKVYLFAYK